jgi:hypothetical protein
VKHKAQEREVIIMKQKTMMYKGVAITLEYDEYDLGLIFVSFSNSYDCISFYKIAESRIITEAMDYINTGILRIAHTVELMSCGGKYYRVNQNNIGYEA